MKILLPVFLIFAFCVSAISQQPDRWHGLIVDEATPDEAIKLLGEPKSEKKSDKMMSYRNKGLRDVAGLRILHWEKTEGFDDIKLYFVEGTLAIIQLEKPKDKIPAKVFIDAYPDVEFRIARGANYEAFYEVEAVTPKSKISAGIGNVTGSVSRNLLGGFPQAGRIDRLEGNVVLIFIQSHRMDDKRGVDALK